MSVARWLRAVLLVGLLYMVIGLATAELARQHGGIAWRWVAWAISAVVFVAHIGFELRRQRSAPTTAAFHAALAVALGAFGLAAAATIRAVTIGSFRGAYLLALAAWPAMTGVAAFVAARLIATVVSVPGTASHDAQ